MIRDCAVVREPFLVQRIAKGAGVLYARLAGQGRGGRWRLVADRQTAPAAIPATASRSASRGLTRRALKTRADSPSCSRKSTARNRTRRQATRRRSRNRASQAGCGWRITRKSSKLGRRTSRTSGFRGARTIAVGNGSKRRMPGCLPCTRHNGDAASSLSCAGHRNAGVDEQQRSSRLPSRSFVGTRDSSRWIRHPARSSSRPLPKAPVSDWNRTCWRWKSVRP